MLSEGRQTQSISIPATVLALVLGLAVLGGCASGGAEGDRGDTGAPASGSDESYPNLGDVPDRPATMTEEQREQLQQGLVADSQQREYSEEVIGFQADPAEPLPAPMETGAGGAPSTSLGDVTMPGAVTPPFSGGDDPPSNAPEPSTPPSPAVATPPSTPPSPAASTPPPPAASTAAPPSASTPPPAAMPVAPTATAETAAAAAQAAPTNIPVPPEDPMARATTPPFSGASGSVSTPPVPQPAATYTPPTASPAPSYTPVAPSYTPVPGPPDAVADDPSTSNLNRAQLDSLQPASPPFSGTTGAAPGSYAPTPLTGAAAATSASPPATSGYTPPPATSAYTSPPAASASALPPATSANTSPPATSAYPSPPATSAYPPPPATPAYSAPPAGVQQVYEERLQDTLPTAPVASLPPAGDLDGDEPLTTVVVSSSGVARFEELPVNVPVLKREPVPAAVAGGQRRSKARSAVPSGSVKVATILFADGSFDLRDREKEIVRTVYERYLSSGRKVRVVGHSSSRTRNMDTVRHRMVNFGLSAERANAVATELKRLGVPSDQITVVAASDDMPMYYEVMPAGEAGNRRAEIYLD